MTTFSTRVNAELQQILYLLSGILIPQQVWTPQELSTEDLALKPELTAETENVAQVANGATPSNTSQSHQKKRTAASKENEAGGNENRAPKRQKKAKKKKKKQRPLRVLPTENETLSRTESGVTVGGSSTEVGSVESESTVESEPQTRDASEFGMHLLQKVKLIMLDFVTVVNRRWRSIKDAAHPSWPDGGKSDQVQALTTDIHESRHDLTRMRNYSSSSVKVAAQKIELSRFEPGSSALPQLLRGVKLFMQQLVVVVRRYRRSLCAARGLTVSRPTSGANRVEELESMASTIAVLQDDLRDGLNEMVATAELVSYDSEKTDTDDET